MTTSGPTDRVGAESTALDEAAPAFAGFAPRPLIAGQSTTGAVVAFRARMEPGSVALPALGGDAEHVTFGLSSSPLTLRTLTGSFRIAAHAPWAVSRSRAWRAWVEKRSDLRLVHVRDLSIGDSVARPFRFEGAQVPIVRATLRTAAPLWVDQRLRQVDNLATADSARIRMVDPAREPAYLAELRSVFGSLAPWAVASEDPVHPHGLAPVIQYIDAHLADPALGATTIAAQTLVSRRTLQTQFSSYGGVAAYIRRRRVVAAVAQLTADPTRMPELDDVAVATGLGSRRTLERAIRGVYDHTPLQVRNRILAGLPLRLRETGNADPQPAAS